MTHKFLGRIPSARLVIFAIASLAALALSAFDTPYLTFKSASSFSLSATKRWDGTLQKATSNPTDEASWSDWTGSSITAGLSDAQYYIYLRGKDNTTLNNSSCDAREWGVACKLYRVVSPGKTNLRTNCPNLRRTFQSIDEMSDV